MAFQRRQQLQNGKYAIEAELGRGRFGVTYLAKDRQGNRCAIKTLLEGLVSQPEFERWQESFMQEATKLAQCRHPHIVKAGYPFCDPTTKLWCLPMEYVAGATLDRLVVTSPLPETEALDYIRQIGEALTVVHKQELIHRDVKPTNIIIRAGKQEAVLIDFGLARKFNHTVTLSGMNPKEGFQAPEMYSSDKDRGPHTDVYSLAATLYYVLTREVPKSGNELKPPQELNPQISTRVNEAILKGLNLEIKDRPKTIQEWLSLLGISSSEASNSRYTQGSVLHPLIAKIKRWDANTWIQFAIAIAAFLTAIATFVTLFKPDSPSQLLESPSETEILDR